MCVAVTLLGSVSPCRQYTVSYRFGRCYELSHLRFLHIFLCFFSFSSFHRFNCRSIFSPHLSVSAPCLPLLTLSHLLFFSYSSFPFPFVSFSSFNLLFSFFLLFSSSFYYFSSLLYSPHFSHLPSPYRPLSIYYFVLSYPLPLPVSSCLTSPSPSSVATFPHPLFF